MMLAERLPLTFTSFAKSAPCALKFPSVSIRINPDSIEIPPCLNGCNSKSAPSTLILLSANFRLDPTDNWLEMETSEKLEPPRAIRPRLNIPKFASMLLNLKVLEVSKVSKVSKGVRAARVAIFSSSPSILSARIWLARRVPETEAEEAERFPDTDALP